MNSMAAVSKVERFGAGNLAGSICWQLLAAAVQRVENALYRCFVLSVFILSDAGIENGFGKKARLQSFFVTEEKILKFAEVCMGQQYTVFSQDLPVWHYAVFCRKKWGRKCYMSM